MHLHARIKPNPIRWTYSLRPWPQKRSPEKIQNMWLRIAGVRIPCNFDQKMYVERNCGGTMKKLRLMKKLGRFDDGWK